MNFQFYKRIYNVFIDWNCFSGEWCGPWASCSFMPGKIPLELIMCNMCSELTKCSVIIFAWCLLFLLHISYFCPFHFLLTFLLDCENIEQIHAVQRAAILILNQGSTWPTLLAPINSQPVFDNLEVHVTISISGC